MVLLSLGVFVATLVSAADPSLGGRPPLFGPTAIRVVPGRALAVAVGDVTHDGRNDVVVTTSNADCCGATNRLWVFAQTRNGKLARPVSYRTDGEATSVAVGDITGDGREDIVVGLYRVGVALYPQRASGSLGPARLIATSDNSEVRLGQLNGDRRLDVAAIGWGTNTVSVFLNDGYGHLREPISYAAPHEGDDDLEVGDVTGDRRADLVVMSGQGLGPNITVLARVTGGQFSFAGEYRIPGRVQTHGIGIGDVTGDGRKDVVVSYGASVAVLAQKPGRKLGKPVSYRSSPDPEPVDVADLDGDGRADIVTIHGGGTAGIYRHRRNGTLRNEERYRLPYATHYRPEGLAVGDVNGDHGRDIVVADYNHGLVILRNTAVR